MSAIFGNNRGTEFLEHAAEQAGIPVLVMHILELVSPSFSRLNDGERLELADRAIRFARTPSGERTNKLPGIKYSFCTNEEVAELSNAALNGEPTEAEMIEFITHAKQCGHCNGNFISLLWATTGD